jgi:hypothetical protein
MGHDPDIPGLIDRYLAGGERLSLSIRGLTREDLLCIPDPSVGVGKWSIQQVVVHVLDADLVMAERIKRIIAEPDNPPLLAFDENRWIDKLHYDAQSADLAVKLLEGNRAMLAAMLRALPRECFERAGEHNQRGAMKLIDVLTYAADHLEHHVKFIHDKRARMGKEMW